MRSALEHTDTELLRAYFERRVLDSEASAIADHLEGCDACSGQYLSFLLGVNSDDVRVPDEIWHGIQARLLASASAGRSKQDSGIFGALSFAALLVLVVAIAIPLLRWRLFEREATTLEMGQYLTILEHSSNSSGVARLRAQFEGFVPYDRGAALVEGRVQPQVENYRLVEQVGWRSRALHQDVIQLLYDSGTDTFALFVVPRGSALNFGKYQLTSAEVGGRQCRRVTCPREDVYVWTARGHDYVFVRRHSSAISSERLFAELIQGIP
jgi:hypothetical protein